MKIINRDLDLISACIDGSRTAQKQLYDMYRVKMYTLCLRYMSCKLDAEDMLQEGWVKVFREINSYDPEKGTFYGWIRKVFVNTNLEFLRKKKLQFEDLQEDNFSKVGYNSTIIDDMSMQEMVKTLQGLPSGYRSVFNLYVIEGYTHKEIGKILGITDSTSKTQLMKAKKIMRAKVILLRVV